MKRRVPLKMLLYDRYKHWCPLTTHPPTPKKKKFAHILSLFIVYLCPYRIFRSCNYRSLVILKMPSVRDILDLGFSAHIFIMIPTYDWYIFYLIIMLLDKEI